MLSNVFPGDRTQPAPTKPRLTAVESSSNRLIPFSVPVLSPEFPLQPSDAPVDLFDLRQSIMRYTNPLRTKILLFSLLYHPLPAERAAGTFLKSHCLDQLLGQTLCRYRRYDTLAVHLKQVARQLDDPVEYDQVIHAILRSVKPLYLKPRDL